MFKETHPILGTRDIQRAIEFYTRRLGFQLAFRDKTDPPNYVGFRRDAVELHMQFQFEHEMGTIRLGFLVEDPDALFNEYRQCNVDCTPNRVDDTPWGTANSLSTIWIATRLPSTGSDSRGEGATAFVVCRATGGQLGGPWNSYSAPIFVDRCLAHAPETRIQMQRTTLETP